MRRLPEKQAAMSSKYLRKTSTKLFQMQQRLKGEPNRQKKQGLLEETLSLQRSLQSDLEA
jgi:hypothetical protein